MLVLRRKEGQWIEVTHKGGDRLRIRAFRIEGGTPGRVDLAFDDAARNFEIQRPERRAGLASPGPIGAGPSA